MEIEIVCTVCSREKDQAAGRLPAYLRYKGAHIPRVGRIAKDKWLPFYIVSGLYGLIPAEDRIVNYDKSLPAEMEEIERLASLIRSQLASYAKRQNRRITKIHFHSECKVGWAPYQAALEKAARAFGITVELYVLQP